LEILCKVRISINKLLLDLIVAKYIGSVAVATNVNQARKHYLEVDTIAISMHIV